VLPFEVPQYKNQRNLAHESCQPKAKGEKEHCIFGAEELGMLGLPTDPNKPTLPINFWTLTEKGFFGRGERECMKTILEFVIFDVLESLNTIPILQLPGNIA